MRTGVVFYKKAGMEPISEDVNRIRILPPAEAEGKGKGIYSSTSPTMAM